MAHPKLTRRPSANKIMFFPFLSVNLSTWGLMLTFFVQFSSIHLTSISQSKWPRKKNWYNLQLFSISNISSYGRFLAKVSFFVQCTKKQLIILQNFNIQTWCFSLKIWFKSQIISRIHPILSNAYKLMCL